MNASFELWVGKARIPVFINGFKENPDWDEEYAAYMGDLARKEGENQAMWESRIRALGKLKPNEPLLYFPRTCPCCEKTSDDIGLYLSTNNTEEHQPYLSFFLCPSCAAVEAGIKIEIKHADVEKDRTPTEIANDLNQAGHLQIVQYMDQRYSQRQIAQLTGLSQTTVGYHIRRHQAKECRCFALTK